MPYGFNDDKSVYNLESALAEIESLQNQIDAMQVIKTGDVKLSASGLTTTGTMSFRRIGNVVMVSYQSNMNAGTANNPYTVGVIPVGFRPTGSSQAFFGRGVVGNTIGNTVYRFILGTNGNISYSASATGNLTAYCSLMYITTDAMPN